MKIIFYAFATSVFLLTGCNEAVEPEIDLGKYMLTVYCETENGTYFGDRYQYGSVIKLNDEELGRMKHRQITGTNNLENLMISSVDISIDKDMSGVVLDKRPEVDKAFIVDKCYRSF